MVRFCSEVHIGHVGHEIRTCTGPKSGFRGATHVWKRGATEDVVYFPYCYHLYDRAGNPRVVHKDRLLVPRLPAVLELCIQAGLDHEDYPSKRRKKPVYWIDGRMADFDQEMGEAETENNQQSDNLPSPIPIYSDSTIEDEKPSELGAKILESWSVMRSGAEEMMKTYAVRTCGYCPEVQVGPKGHKVRWCRAAKHQSRQGQHAWQEATLDDLIGPNYVWHVRDPHGPPLFNELKRYYGKAPAVVELCVQAGASVPREYHSMMRSDVVPPDHDEFDLVA